MCLEITLHLRNLHSMASSLHPYDLPFSFPAHWLFITKRTRRADFQAVTTCVVRGISLRRGKPVTLFWKHLKPASLSCYGKSTVPFTLVYANHQLASGISAWKSHHFYGSRKCPIGHCWSPQASGVWENSRAIFAVLPYRSGKRDRSSKLALQSAVCLSSYAARKLTWNGRVPKAVDCLVFG